eukprot:XP_014068720.1 PREDICTED: rab11 family-interacting protein 5-like [Salmo salar]
MSSGPVVESEGSRAQANLAVTSVYREGPPSHLAVTVLRATGLRAKTFHGGSNPYAILQLGQRRITTPVIHDTLTPHWNCELTFPLPSSAPRDATAAALTLTIHHRRSLLALPDKFLGTVSFRLEDVVKKKDGNKEWYVLNSEPRKKLKKRGHVEVSFRLYRESSCLPSHSQPVTQTHSQSFTQTYSQPLTQTKSLSHSQPSTILSHSTSLSKPSNLPSHSLTQPQSQSHFQPSSSICTKSHISWESDTHCLPPSVQPVVKHWEPNHPSCGEENSGVLDSVPPPSVPADSSDCVSITTAECSNNIRSVSYFPASILTCETGDLEDGQEARECLLDPGRGHNSRQGPLEETSTAGSTIGTQTSSKFQMFPFQHSQCQGRGRRVSFRSSFLSRLRRLRYRLDSGEASGERRTLRLPVCSRMFSRSTSPPYDMFPKIDVSERPQGFLSRLFPCLGRRE